MSRINIGRARPGNGETFKLAENDADLFRLDIHALQAANGAPVVTASAVAGPVGPQNAANPFPAGINLGSLGSAGIRIGGEAGTVSGFIVSAAGDVNNDGIDDFLVGNIGKDGTLSTMSLGEASVIYGKSGLSSFTLAPGIATSAGFRIAGEDYNENSGTSFHYSNLGDINNDGFDDVLFGALAYNTGSAAANDNVGAAYIVFGAATGRGTVQLSSSMGANGFKILGAALGDQAGKGSAAGDFNHDGIADFAIAAPFADNGGVNSGYVQLFFGKATGWANLTLGGSTTPSVSFIGAAGDTIGEKVSSAGDVNNDGIDDLIISATHGTITNYNTTPGSAYVVFGSATATGTINLTTMTSAVGFRITGDGTNKVLGASVSGIGDFNGDGFDDVVVGQALYYGSPGRAYVVFGSASGANVTVSDSMAASTGFVIIGAGTADAGFSVSSAGDFNGDGLADLIIGAPDRLGGIAPSAYVIFGKSIGIGTINLASLSASDGFRITGANFSNTGFSVAGIGDVNNDGADDIMVGASGEGAAGEGASYIIFGVSSNTAPVVDLNGGVAGTGSTLAYLENGAAAALAPTATVTDADSANFDTGTLTVNFTANGSVDDRLTILNQGNGAGQIGISGNAVSYGGVQIGTFTGGINGSTPLVVTLDPDATPAAVQALAQAIAYSNVSDSPSTSARNVQFVVTDGDGGTSSAVTATVNVTAVNDSPVLDASRSPTFLAIAEDTGAPVGAVGSLVSSLVDFATPAGQVDNVTDPDGALPGIAITGVNSANGTLYYSLNGGSDWAAVGAVSNSSSLLLIANGATRLYFQPAANFNGTISDVITFRAWDQSAGFAGQFVSSVANGGTTPFSTATDTVSLTVNAVNDAPVLDASRSPVLIGVNEDPGLPSGAVGTQVSSLVDLAPPAGGLDNVSDADASPLLGIAITGIAAGGTLYYSTNGGASWTAAGALSNGAALLLAADANTRVYFQPAANASGSISDAITFRAWDQTSGTAGTLADTSVNGGTTAFSSTTDTASINVTGVNDAPTATNLSGDAATWVEGSGPVHLDVGGNAVIADVDSSNFDGGSLTITITNPNIAQDQLGIDTSGTVSMAGNVISVGGIAIATRTGAGAVMNFTFNADATPAAVQALVQAITFTNNGGISPVAGTRNISWTFVDGDGTANGGADTLSLTTSVNVVAINDAPTGTDATYVINEDATYVFTAASFGFSDVNNDGFTGVVITTVPVPGTLFYDADGVGGAAGTPFNPGGFILISEINLGHLYFTPVANGNGIPFTSFTFQVVDNAGTANGGQDTDQSPNTITFNVTAVNDAPINGVPLAQSINEDASLTLSTGSGNALSVSDVDATTLTVTLSVAHGTLTLASVAGLSFGAGDGTADATMTISGTASAINAALGSGLTYTPTTNYNGADAISVTTTDGGQTGSGPVGTDSDSIAITVNSVNDAPSGANNTLTGSEDDPLVFTAADFGFSDPVEGNAFLAVRIMSFPANGTLFLDVDGPGGAAPVNLSSVGVGVYVGIADINAGHLYFQPDADEYGDGYASFTFQVQDNGGIANGGVDLDPTANTIVIDIEPDNLAPVVDLNGAGGGIDYTTTFVEDGAAVAIGAGVLVSDPDAVPLGDLIEGATITLTDRVAGDSLTLTGALPGGFTVLTTNLAGSIEIEISGTGTGAQYQALIESILYATTNQDPTVGGTDLARTITVTVNDGDIDSAVATTIVNINAVDDLPVAQPDAFTINEDGVISGANLFANNGSGADSDPDGPPLSISAVNGSAGNVGTQIVLASGALLTVNANGTFSYDTNGAFDPTPTAGSGASNTPAHDGFSYTLAGGNMVSVTITLAGLDTDDVLFGTAGVDVMFAGAGNDYLDGLAGSDQLHGQTGNDVYTIDYIGDQVFEAAGEGNDIVYAATSYALAAGQEIEALVAQDNSATVALNLTGNDYANTILGNNGANALDGGAGADVLAGYGGDDIYTVDSVADQVFEGAGGGNDSVYASASYALAAGQSVELLSARDNSTTFAQNLAGNELANVIFGSNGANYIDGGAGADVLAGFGGDDVYTVDNAGDQVFEGTGGGTDTVYAAASWVLGAGQSVEVLAAQDNSATVALNLTGNELGQYILGNGGANIITGGGGADLLAGYGGNDTYYVDGANAQVFEGAGGGNDAVYTSGSYTLAAGQEIELLAAASFASTTALTLTGNEFNNTLYGNAGANVLDGKGGNDVLVGQGGADVFAFTTAIGAGNVDQVLDFVHGTDKVALDDAVFTAIGGLGTLDAGAFVTGSAAADAGDRIIYNNATGQLFYDADGNGAGAAILFAQMSPGLTLTASDFQVI